MKWINKKAQRKAANLHDNIGWSVQIGEPEGRGLQVVIPGLLVFSPPGGARVFHHEAPADSGQHQHDSKTNETNSDDRR